MEQKNYSVENYSVENYSVVRKAVGYRRYDTEQEVKVLNTIYAY